MQDLIRILGSRWPMAEVKIIPVRVQGDQAPGEIAAALHWADANHVADLLITGRGGGSIEDLWAFNEEIVARAIYSVHTPVISAVGHEPDVTIADLVADLRAATPSNAAELSVPDQNEIAAVLSGERERLESAILTQLARYRKNLEHLAASRPMTEPVSFFREKRLLLDYQSSRLFHGLRSNTANQQMQLKSLSASLASGMEYTLAKRRKRLETLAAALDALSPLKVLSRGYAIAQRVDGKTVTSTGDVASGDKLKLTMTDGSIDCRVL